MLIQPDMSAFSYLTVQNQQSLILTQPKKHKDTHTQFNSIVNLSQGNRTVNGRTMRGHPRVPGPWLLNSIRIWVPLKMDCIDANKIANQPALRHDVYKWVIWRAQSFEAPEPGQLSLACRSQRHTKCESDSIWKRFSLAEMEAERWSCQQPARKWRTWVL